MGGTRVKHQDDQVMAVSLLALMREPERHISQVREVCEITGRLDTREIEIEFSSKASSSSLETHQSPAVIDIAHPKKGKLLNFEILSPPEQATRIDHASHIWVAQYLIYFRFMSLIRPITLNDHSDSDFAAPGVDSTLEHLLDALETLLKIPQENNVAKARLALDSVFKVEDGEPELLPELKIPFTADRIKGLYALCEMLTERYLVLIEVEQHENRPCLLRYRHSHAIEEYNQHPVRARIGGLSAAWNSAKNFFRAFFGVPPTHMRIHVPWAKRTSDYKLFCEAPREVFITHHRIRAHKRTPEGDSFDTLPGEGVLWSRNSSSGINAHCFIGNGYRERADHALHVTFQHVENLGGPSLRLVIASVTMMVVMWGPLHTTMGRYYPPPGQRHTTSSRAGDTCAGSSGRRFVSAGKRSSSFRFSNSNSYLELHSFARHPYLCGIARSREPDSVARPRWINCRLTDCRRIRFSVCKGPRRVQKGY